jgi:hypothetical protein
MLRAQAQAPVRAHIKIYHPHLIMMLCLGRADRRFDARRQPGGSVFNNTFHSTVNGDSDVAKQV